MLAIGGCTVRELQERMAPAEVEDWHRFFMVFGPVGDRRFDEQFTYLRHTVWASRVAEPPSEDECRLKFDYRRCFPKDPETELEEFFSNQDAEIERFVGKMRKNK